MSKGRHLDQDTLAPGTMVVDRGDDSGGQRYIFIEKVHGLQAKARLSPITSSDGQWPITPLENLQKYEFKREPELDDIYLDLILRQLSSVPFAGHVSMVSGRTVFKAYQFRPLLKYLGSSDHRLLIADEVGLGKTIETGYILLEEMARWPMERVLIICPSHLKNKWRRELWYRFGLPFTIVHGKTLLTALENGNGFHYIASIDSMRNNIKSLRSVISAPLKALDMLIIDEVHHLIGRGGDTIRREMGMLLSLSSERVVGLSATPIQTRQEDLFRIVQLLDPGWAFTELEPDLSNRTELERKEKELFEEEMELTSLLYSIDGVLRKSKFDTGEQTKTLILIEGCNQRLTELNMIGQERLSDIQRILEEVSSEVKAEIFPVRRDQLRKKVREQMAFANRISRTRRIELPEDERRKRLIKKCLVELGTEGLEVHQGPEGWVSVSEKGLYEELDDFLKREFFPVHRLQLSSSLPAMVGLLRNGMKGFNTWSRGNEVITDLEWEQMTDIDERKGWKVERRALSKDAIKEAERICNKFGPLLKDSKWDELKEIIVQFNDEQKASKIIVFTRWVPTIDYLSSMSPNLEGIRTFVTTGRDSTDAKERKMEDFQSHEGFAVLFASDVVSEGVDLYTADCIINYDLMLNPQRIEQRIGRVDRIGQRSKEVTVINLVVKGSLDEMLLTRVLEPIDAFERALGPMGDTIVQRYVAGEDIEDLDDVRQRKMEEDIKRLEHEQELIGVDDLLDDEIRKKQQASRFMTEKQFEALFKRFLNLMTDGRAELVPKGEGTFEIVGLEEQHIETIAHLCPNEVYQNVRRELGGMGTITFSPGLGSSYLPLQHPVVRLAIRVMEANPSFLGKPSLPHMIRGDSLFERITGWEGQLALLEYGHDNERGTSKTQHWWRFDEERNKVEKLDDIRLDDIFNALFDSPPKLIRGRTEHELPKTLERAISQDVNDWAHNQERRDIVHKTIQLESEKKRRWGELYEVERRIADGGERKDGDDALFQRQKRIKKEICSLEEQIGELNKGPFEVEDAPMGEYRVLMVIFIGDEGNGQKE